MQISELNPFDMVTLMHKAWKVASSVWEPESEQIAGAVADEPSPEPGISSDWRGDWECPAMPIVTDGSDVYEHRSILPEDCEWPVNGCVAKQLVKSA